MSIAGAWQSGLLTLATVLLALAPPPVASQAGSKYEVRAGDTMFAVVRKTQHKGVTRNQMIAALYRANRGQFQDRSIHSLAVGMVLDIPAREVVAAIPRAEADREVRELLARPPAGPLPTVKVAPPPQLPAPTPAPKAKPQKPRAAISPEDAARLYREGLASESRGDDKGALQAFLAAGEAGHGLAQRKLGEIYDRGNSATPRDYETALKWYQKAREQGVEIPRPFIRSPR